MAGTLVIDNLTDGSGNTTSATNAIRGSAKAWVNFNGVTTATIRASYNVSSVTRNATGDYTVNFTNSLTDANYSVVAAGMRNIAEGTSTQPATIRPYHDTVYGNVFTAGSVRLKSTVYSGSADDALAVTVAIFR